MSGDPQGFEPIGLGLRPNDGTGDAPRVVGDKLNRMLRGVFARLEASEAALEEAQAVIAELLAGGGVTPTPTPTPTPSFTMLPAIVTDGTPIVGELATFDFGTISGGVAGARRLVTSTGVDVADASSGTFQWTAAGEFKLRVTIVGTAITAESAVVTVLAQSLGDLDPGSPGETTIGFPADRAAGANPVTLLSQTASSAPGDGLQIRVGHGASLDAIAWMDWLDAVISPGDEDNEVRSFTIDQELIAGRTWFQGRATRAKDTNNNAIPVRYGSASNIVDDTLQAAGGTPAPTPTPTPPASGTTTIAPPTSGDNDVSTFGFTTTSITKAEGNSGTTAYEFGVARAGGTTYAATVDWQAGASGSNPATSGDFAGGAVPSGTLAFAANVTTGTITINVGGDTALEQDETFTVTLTNPQTAGVISTATATGTITNDDAATAPSDQSVTTLDPATKNAYVTLSNGNLTMNGTNGVNAYMSVKSTSSKGTLTGDSYFEAVCTGTNNSVEGIGLIPTSVTTAGSSFAEVGKNTQGIMWVSQSDGEALKYNNTQPVTEPNPPAWGANGDVVGCLLRTTMSGSTPSYKVFYHKNGVWINATGDPYSSGAGIAVTTTEPLFAAATTKGEDVFTYRFKAADQTYKPASASAWGV